MQKLARGAAAILLAAHTGSVVCVAVGHAGARKRDWTGGLGPVALLVGRVTDSNLQVKDRCSVGRLERVDVDACDGRMCVTVTRWSAVFLSL